MRDHVLLFCLLGLVLTAMIMLVMAPGTVTWALSLMVDWADAGARFGVFWTTNEVDQPLDSTHVWQLQRALPQLGPEIQNWGPCFRSGLILGGVAGLRAARWRAERRVGR